MYLLHETSLRFQQKLQEHLLSFWRFLFQPLLEPVDPESDVGQFSSCPSVVAFADSRDLTDFSSLCLRVKQEVLKEVQGMLVSYKVVLKMIASG